MQAPAAWRGWRWRDTLGVASECSAGCWRTGRRVHVRVCVCVWGFGARCAFCAEAPGTAEPSWWTTWTRAGGDGSAARRRRLLPSQNRQRARRGGVTPTARAAGRPAWHRLRRPGARRSRPRRKSLQGASARAPRMAHWQQPRSLQPWGVPVAPGRARRPRRRPPLATVARVAAVPPGTGEKKSRQSHLLLLPPGAAQVIVSPTFMLYCTHPGVCNVCLRRREHCAVASCHYMAMLHTALRADAQAHCTVTAV